MMKWLWALSFFFVFSAEIKVKASANQKQQVMSCQDSWIEGGRLISGCHWLRGADQAELKTVHGDIQTRNGDYTVKMVNNRIFVVNHLGDLQVNLRDGRTVQVPPGFEFWFSELGLDKKNQMGLLRPVEMREHLEFLSSVWKGSSEALKAEVLMFKNRWGDRTEMAARFYQGLVQRRLASVEAVQAKARQKALEEKNRREANRKLLFERVFGR